MRTILTSSLILCLAMGRSAPARAGDPVADARALVAKAIQAQGGFDRLSKRKAATWKAKGTFFGAGQTVEFSGEWWLQPPALSKSVIDFNINGQKTQRIQVSNGERGWLVDQAGRREMSPGELMLANEAVYGSWVGMLIPLQDPAFQLMSTGDAKVGDRPAATILVSHRGHADLKLYFDKETGQLVRSLRRIQDPTIGQEFDEDNFYSDYKDYDGIKHYNRLKIMRNGKDYVDIEMTEYKPLEKLDENLFRQP